MQGLRGRLIARDSRAKRARFGPIVPTAIPSSFALYADGNRSLQLYLKDDSPFLPDRERWS
jgi:hypothetical protein